MASEGTESSSRRGVDLDLCLGLPYSPRGQSFDLGAHLALSPAPMPTVIAEEVAGALPSAIHAPYSPTRASFSPEPSVNANHSPVIAPFTPANIFSSEYGSPSLTPIQPHYSTGPQLPVTMYSSPGYLRDPLAVEDEVGFAHVPYAPAFLADFVGVPAASTGGLHVPCLPSYVPVMADVGPRNEFPVQTTGGFARNGASSSHQGRARATEFRFRSSIEPSNRFRARRFRSSFLRRDGQPNGNASAFAANEQHLCDMLPERSVETYGKNIASDDNVANESLEEKAEEKCASAVNFECNICLEVAKEPVVTSCGHLFCWPCLYQWIHIHSDHRECPVCKGEVVESNITPIYGRGSSEAKVGRCAESRDSGLKIPPRPSGRRYESLRQWIQRPVSRRVGDGISEPSLNVGEDELQNTGRFRASLDPNLQSFVLGQIEWIPNPERPTSDEEMQSGGVLERQLDPNMQRIIDSAYVRLLTRMERLTADLSRSASRVAGNNNSSTATSSTAVNLQFPEPLGVGSSYSHRPRIVQPVGGRRSVGQGAASSTMAIIHEDAGTPDASLETSIGLPSRFVRRRERIDSPSSLDTDGGILHARRRRRLN